MTPNLTSADKSRYEKILEAYFSSEYMEEMAVIRQQSFDFLARSMAISPEELEETLLEAMRRDSQVLIEYYKKYPVDAVHLQTLEAIPPSMGYQERAFMQELYQKTKSIDQFLELYHGIWEIENLYLRSIATRLAYPLQELKNKDDYYDFLVQIPFVYSYELDFNAFLSLSNKGNRIPVIRYNKVLFTVVDIFIETIAYVICETNDQYRTSALRTVQKIAEVSKETAVQMSIYSVMDMLIGKAAAAVRINVGEEAAHTIRHGISNAILPFIQYHEFGHLFCGHLELEYNREMEYEADRFALFSVKSLLEKNNATRFKAFLGLSAFYILLYCREILLPLANQSQYPTAQERMLRLAATFNVDDRRKMVQAWNNVVLATNHTLQTHFQIEIPLANLPGNEASPE